MGVKLAIEITGFILEHAHQSYFAGIKAHGDYLYDISNGIVGQVFKILSILSAAMILTALFVLLHNLKTKMRAFQ